MVEEKKEPPQPPKSTRKFGEKPQTAKERAMARDDTAAETPSNNDKPPTSNLAEEDSMTKPKNAPKPFLKRKTKTMQPAKINWKAKSRLDCWNAGSNKREVVSPPQKAPPAEKTQIEMQQELESSMPKFSDN